MLSLSVRVGCGSAMSSSCPAADGSATLRGTGHPARRPSSYTGSGSYHRPDPQEVPCPLPTTATVDQIADQYVERHAALDPVAATMEGIGGHDTEMTDYSPDAAEERAEHDRATLRALAAATPVDRPAVASPPR